MAEKKKQDDVIFAPTGRSISQDGKIDKSTKLPSPTRKKHKTLGFSEDDLLDMFREMYLQRRFEERSMQVYQKGKISGFLHLYMGQEAISTGTARALNSDDDIITAY